MPAVWSMHPGRSAPRPSKTGSSLASTTAALRSVCGSRHNDLLYILAIWIGVAAYDARSRRRSPAGWREGHWPVAKGTGRLCGARALESVMSTTAQHRHERPSGVRGFQVSSSGGTEESPGVRWPVERTATPGSTHDASTAPSHRPIHLLCKIHFHFYSTNPSCKSIV